MKPFKQDFTINSYDAKPLPFSDELEKNVLAEILNHPSETLPAALKFLSAKGMFYDTLNEELWKLIRGNNPVSIIKIQGIYQGFRDSVKLNHFECVCRIFTLPSEFQTNCLLLNEFWIKRTIHRLGHYLNANSLRNDNDPLELLGVGSESLNKIYQHIAQMREITLKDGVRELSKEIVEISSSVSGILGLPGSMRGLNNAIKGYRKGNLISIAATTAEGKTTLAIQEIRHWIENNIPVGAISLEMTIKEYILMMTCDALNIPSENILGGNISAAESVAIGKYTARVEKMPFKISDKPAMKIGEIKSLARLWKKNNNIQILVIDHGHLIEGDIPYSNSEQKFTDIANQIKALAKELDIPIICLWQLARKDSKDKIAHKISDIKYAGGVEQASDVVLLIYRPEMHGIRQDADGATTKGFARLIIGKLRLLPRYDIKCHFTGTRFVDYHDWKMEQAGKEIHAPKGFQPMDKNIESNTRLNDYDDTPF